MSVYVCVCMCITYILEVYIYVRSYFSNERSRKCDRIAKKILIKIIQASFKISTLTIKTHQLKQSSFSKNKYISQTE